MNFTTDFTALSLDLRAYRKDMLNALRKWNSIAGTAWIRAAVDKTPIPTWSGASRATFQKLARELGTSVPIGPIRAPKSRVSLGARTSSGSGVVEKGEYVGFVYETDLRYLAYNEYNRAVAGKPPQPFSNRVRFTPYRFQSRAEAAWRRYAREVKLPNPWAHLTRRKM